MTKDQYNEVCRLTDEILKSPSTSSTRVAIPWLHVLSAHHVYLKGYEGIYDDSIGSYYKNTKQKVLNIILLFVVLAQSLFYSRYSKWLKAFNFHPEIDIVFVSHLLRKSHYSKENDFYFSDLPQKVSKAGFNSFVIMINQTSRKINSDNQKNLKKTVLPLRLGFYDELQNLGLLLAEYKALNKEMHLEENKKKKKVLHFAAIHSLSGSSLASLRIAMQVSGLVKKLGTSTLITTHEGHAWERKVYDAARKAVQNINCIGYTHTPIFENQHAVKRSMIKQYNPDTILISGRAQKKQLENYGLLKNIEIDILGSVRYIDGQANDAGLKIMKKINRAKKQFFLVTPEGHKDEMNLLFDFSLKCALAMPECYFIWRLHPLFEFHQLKYANLPENIILSDQKLDDDLLKSQWLLYRGSSVVIQAVVAGLRPIYFHRANEIKIDPIYEIENWKSEVESVQDFKSVVSQEKRHYSDFQQAFNYCKDLNYPINEKILIESIRKNNLC